MARDHKSIAVRGLLAALAVPLLTFAASSPAAAQKVEVTPYVGYRFYSDFEGRIDVGEVLDNAIDIDDGTSLGLFIDIAMTDDLQLELIFARQGTTVLLDSGLFTSQRELFDLDIDYYQIGVLWAWSPGPVRPYLAGGIGLTTLSPDQGSLDDEDFLSLNVGGGVKVFFTETVGARFDLRIFSTVLDEADDNFCHHGGHCNFTTDTFDQAELSAGLIFAF